MCPPVYHHNGFVATHALGHMMYGYIYINKTNLQIWIIDKIEGLWLLHILKICIFKTQ